jgi:hypothetical protein
VLTGYPASTRKGGTGPFPTRLAPFENSNGPIWTLARWLFVPTKAEQYRASAEQCEQWAKEVTYEPARREILEICRQWRAMAEQAERNGW